VGVAMKHVREPLPNVQHLRPEISAVLASVVERATRKELKNRYSTVEEMVHDLEQALAIEAARGAHLTDEATTVLRQLPGDTAGWVPLRVRNPRALLAILGLALAAAAVVLIVLASRTETGETGDAGPRHVASGSGVALAKFAGVKDYDPEGDQHESSASVRLAIDGNRHTFWKTEQYRDGLEGVGKSGVGLWVQTTKPVVGTELDLISPFADWEGAVYGANGTPPEDIGGWKKLSSTFTAQSENKVHLDSAGHPFDHYLVWVTKLAGPQAGIMELSLQAQKR
jgi:eukaryotic-like serine/threonine-protein kinase